MVKDSPLKQILKKERLTERFERIPTYANAVYQLQGELILKVYDSENEWKNTLLAYALIHKYKLASPKIVAKSATPTPYIIMTRLDGRPLTQGADKAAYHSFGKWVGQLHQITFDKFGGLQEKRIGKFHELNKGPFKTWKAMHLALVKDRMKGFEKTILAPLMPRILAYFEAAKYPAFKPTLIHEDLNAKNVFVKKGRVIGVIDPDGAFAGCTEEELMRIEVAHFENNTKLKQEFFKGYREHTKLLSGYEQRRPLFHLSRTLVEARCLIHLKDYKADRKIEAMREAYRIIEEITRKPDLANTRPANIGVDKKGYVLEISKTGHIQKVYTKCIKSTISNVCATFMERVHSIYVYGSIARGTATPYKSDIDVTVILTSPITPEDKNAFDKLSKIIQKENSILYKVDFDPETLRLALAKKNLYSRGFWLKHSCLCIYGNDLGKKLPRFKLSKRIGTKVNKSFPKHMENYAKKIRITKSPAEVKVLCGEIMKRIVRVGFCIVMEKENSWTGDLDISYKLFSKHYPAQAAQMQEVLTLACNPSADKRKILLILNNFGQWIVKEFEAQVITQSKSRRHHV